MPLTPSLLLAGLFTLALGVALYLERRPGDRLVPAGFGGLARLHLAAALA